MGMLYAVKHHWGRKVNGPRSDAYGTNRPANYHYQCGARIHAESLLGRFGIIVYD